MEPTTPNPLDRPVTSCADQATNGVIELLNLMGYTVTLREAFAILERTQVLEEEDNGRFRIFRKPE